MLSASCPQLWPLPQHSPSWQRKSRAEREGLGSGPTCVWNLVGGEGGTEPGWVLGLEGGQQG